MVILTTKSSKVTSITGQGCRRMYKLYSNVIFLDIMVVHGIGQAQVSVQLFSVRVKN